MPKQSLINLNQENENPILQVIVETHPTLEPQGEITQHTEL